MSRPPGQIRLRPVVRDDLPVFFEHQRDGESAFMAAFSAADPRDREAFDARWESIIGDPDIVIRTILVGFDVAGHVLKFVADGETELSYWIGRTWWGRGVATAALAGFLEVVTTRPLFARVAADNVGSIRVLEKCGFVVVAEESGFSAARGREIPELVLELGT